MEGPSTATSARLVPKLSDADEVFQEVSVTLWQKFDQYRPDTDFRAWACRIAYYKVLKLRDRQVRSPRLFSPQFLDLVSEEMIVMSDMLDARTEALVHCRDKLDSRDRELLDHFHRQGTTAKDVAHWMGGTSITCTARSAASTNLLRLHQSCGFGGP